MSTDSTIVAAKQEYTQQLYNLLTPLIYSGFQSIWVKCKLEKKSLLQFQLKLKSIPIWNQTIIDNEYKRIVNVGGCEDWLDKLIEAVFSASVKILSTVKVGKIKNIVNVTIPETKTFIHKCYIETARKLWYDPYMIDDREDHLTYSDIKRNHKRCLLAINDSIDKTISDCIPFQALLESYLNEMMNENTHSSDPGNESESENDHDPSSKSIEVNNEKHSKDSDILSISGESDKNELSFEEISQTDDPFMMNPGSEEPDYPLGPEGPNGSLGNPDLEVVLGETPDTVIDNNESISRVPKSINIPLNRIVDNVTPSTSSETSREYDADEPFFSDSDSEK